MSQDVQSGGTTTRYALIGCGADKRSGTWPARALYKSDLFEKRLKWGETFCEKLWIVSAEHGILHPDAEIEDYDTHISSLSDNELRAWVRDVWLSLRASDGKWVACDQLYVLLPKSYIEPLQAVFDELEDLSVSPVEVVYPFEHARGNGDWRSWLIESVEARDPTPMEPKTADSDADQTSLEGFVNV